MSNHDKYRPSKYRTPNSKRKPNKPTPVEGTTPSSGAKPSVHEIVSEWMEQVQPKPKNESVYYLSANPGTNTTVYDVVWTNNTSADSYWTVWKQEY